MATPIPTQTGPEITPRPRTLPELGRDLHLRPAAALQQGDRFAFELERELSSRLRHPTPSPLSMSVSEVSAMPREDQFGVAPTAVMLIHEGFGHFGEGRHTRCGCRIGGGRFGLSSLNRVLPWATIVRARLANSRAFAREMVRSDPSPISRRRPARR